MIENLKQFFSGEQTIFLKEIQYHIIEDGKAAEEYEVICNDVLNVDLLENEGVQILLTRTIQIDPLNLFGLSVSFGAKLSFGDNKNQINWNVLDLAEEFSNNGDFIISNLASRISALIAQITSSYGQAPLITPPRIGRKQKKR